MVAVLFPSMCTTAANAIALGPSVSLPAYLSVFSSVCLSICCLYLSVCPCICLSVSLSVCRLCLFVWLALSVLSPSVSPTLVSLATPQSQSL